ncbi:hypothetical protein GH714_035447 [Hevea brasiliensis]|uniref:STAS domain-containing protein n=1 Tax=Hevea brasiliensis TaxID=3981 RepID=A0A6A6L8L8_HEVBR|nr:hypothetical protein GH714_035447 [Hevea brasiliensis]
MPTSGARPIKIIPLLHPNATSSSSSSSSVASALFSRWVTKMKRRSYGRHHHRYYARAPVFTSPSHCDLTLDLFGKADCGFVPVFVYAIFGSSRQLATGPVALVSLLVSNVLSGIVDSSDELYTELAILLALMVGILECIMGLLRLGWLIRFISHSVISGFTTASAIVIALSQAKYFLGYDVVRSSKIVPLVKSIISGMDKVGEIPQGLPSFSIPKEFGYAKSLIPTAMLITGVAILESVGIAKALAAKNGYELDSSQECSLAAIVISAVMGLVDYDEAIFLWRVDKKDFLLWTITSATTLFLGIEIGVLVGVGASIAFVIHESANPHIAVLGRLPGTTVYRNIQQYPEAYTYNGIVMVRIDAPIYFANISYIKDRLREYELDVDKSTRHGPEVERIYFVILEMSPVTYIDSSAVQALKDLHQEYKSRDIQIAISNPNRDVLLTLSKAGVVELIGKEWYFVRMHDAVQVCLQQVQSIKQALKQPDPLLDDKPSFFQRLLEQREDDLSAAELESGDKRLLISKNTDSQLEPLLSRKSSN